MCFDDATLHHLWEVELEILDVIHKVCSKYDLRYSLAFGTLIGAVRHTGFIPWDDDIDIIMPRKDYDKLISVWSSAAPSGYILQFKENSPDFEQNFVKIRKDHTAFLQDKCERTKKYHKGIFVDIAPCDRLAPNSFSRKIQYFACAVELLYSKEHTSGTGGAVGTMEKLLLCVPKQFRHALRNQARRLMAHWNSRTDLPCFCSDTIQNCRRYFCSSMLDAFKMVPFQGRQYFAIQNPDDFLRVRYDDYMQLPPEEERVWKHHPLLIDFEHNYEELTQK